VAGGARGGGEGVGRQAIGAPVAILSTAAPPAIMAGRSLPRRGTYRTMEADVCKWKDRRMPLVSVLAVYDGKEIRLLEPPPVRGRYRVLVTFVEPTPDEGAQPADRARFRRSLGAWQDDRPVEETLKDILESRRSRSKPPGL
jgi:hypothetical protein